jgi:hypothetical protein
VPGECGDPPGGFARAEGRRKEPTNGDGVGDRIPRGEDRLHTDAVVNTYRVQGDTIHYSAEVKDQWTGFSLMTGPGVKNLVFWRETKSREERERTGETTDRDRGRARERAGEGGGRINYLIIFIPGVFMSAGRVIRGEREREFGSCVHILFVDQLVHFFTALFAA